DDSVEQTRYTNQPRSYESQQQPRTGYQSGSTYSYSYRDANRSGAGRPEPVVDAEYREVTPYQTFETSDDFDFDEQDWDDEEDDPRGSRR
ncbi:MAG TPA: hypothetical protein V6D03_15705, partial [Candidatus Caenarcaniphilales bacterium]